MTSQLVMRDGEVVHIRPIRPDDEPKMVAFHRTLSDSTVYNRYMGVLKLDTRVAHERLARICFVDSELERVLLAERGDSVVAVARLMRLPGTHDGEFALLVTDSVQNKGLGRAMLLQLFDVGRDWGLERIVAEILPGNGPMRRVCKELGFELRGETGAVKEL